MQAFSSHDIFQTLYQQIMLLELKPGSTLRENALCEQFGVSRTPVRSVLQELRIAGLIEVTPYKSTRVTQLDFEHHQPADLPAQRGGVRRDDRLCRCLHPRTAGPAENPQQCFAPPSGPTPPGPADVL